MEDEERQKKLEAGKAKLAEYRQRKAHADVQKRQKKKKKKKNEGTEDSEGDARGREDAVQDQSVVEQVSGIGGGKGTGGGHDVVQDEPPTEEFTFARTLRSGETVQHDQTYTIEPESEVSTTAEDYSSEVNGCPEMTGSPVEASKDWILEEVDSLPQQARGHSGQEMEEELAAKTLIVEELSRELEEIRATFGTQGVHQLQDFEAALKQRDGIITQLTANLQQARQEKDDIMREFLEMTEKSQKLHIQFQQLQAGETLRNSSHSSAAADLLQARQQLAQQQQQLEDMAAEIKGHQQTREDLQHRLDNMELVGKKAEESFAQRLNKKEMLIAKQEQKIFAYEQSLTQLQEKLVHSGREVAGSYTQTLKEKDLLISKQTAIITEHEHTLSLLKEEMALVGSRTKESFAQNLNEKELRITEQARLMSQQVSSLSRLKEELVASEKRLNYLNQQMASKEQELGSFLSELESCKADLESCQLGLENSQSELESCKRELSTSRQKERVSSNEVMQLMGTVEDLQKQCHQGILTESDAVYRMEEDAARRLEHLRAELDEMYGQQIVEMKQELRLQHTAYMESLVLQHHAELESLKAQQEAAPPRPSAGFENELLAKIAELQDSLGESRELREKARQELSLVAQEKVILQGQVEDLFQNLLTTKGKLELASQSKASLESQQGELQHLQDTIKELRAQLAAAQEAAVETEGRHESETTNYKIKLEMLEREKDAVLDRMAQSQEAELDRLRTQLLFSHEEELTLLREDLQRESFLNAENLLNEAAIKHQRALAELQSTYEEQLRLLGRERSTFAAERVELLDQIVALKEDLKLAMHSSKADELVEQLQELQVEVKDLRKAGDEHVSMKEENQKLLEKIQLLENQQKEKEMMWDNKWRAKEFEKESLTESNNSLKGEVKSQTQKIESLSIENNCMQQQVVQLREEIEKQRNTFSFAEKNFEVNYQQLKEEYICLVEVKTKLEERILKETLEFEAKISSLQSQIRELDCSKTSKMEVASTDDKTVIEKDTTELMEKLNIALSEKSILMSRLSEVTEHMTVTEGTLEQLQVELRQARLEQKQVVTQNKYLEGELEKEQRREAVAQGKGKLQQGPISQLSDPACAVEDHRLQISALQREVESLRSLLYAAETERDAIRCALEVQRQTPSPVQTSKERPEEVGEGAEGAGATSVAAEREQPARMESRALIRAQQRARKEDSSIGDRGRDDTEKQADCRLNLAAQRISMSQIHAAQLELVREQSEALSHAPEQQLGPSPEHCGQAGSKITKYQSVVQVVSEECKQVILSFAKLFGEEFLEYVHHTDVEDWKTDPVKMEESRDPTSVLQEAKELSRVLHQVKERIEQEHSRLLQLQTKLKTHGNKIEEMQDAYDDLKCSREKEVSELRMQINSSNTTTHHVQGFVQQAGAGELDRFKAEMREKQAQLEERHRQEVERLRAYYTQQAKETEECYATELTLLQLRLQEATGTQGHFSLSSALQSSYQREQEEAEELKLVEQEVFSAGLSADLRWPAQSMGLTGQLQTLRRALYGKYIQEVAQLKEQHLAELSRLQQERGGGGGQQDPQDINRGANCITGSSAEGQGRLGRHHQETVEEEIAKVIVQMSVEFAQQRELARITKHARETSSAVQTQWDEESEKEEHTPRVSSTTGLSLEELERRFVMEKESLEKELSTRTNELRKLKQQLGETGSEHGQKEITTKGEEDTRMGGSGGRVSSPDGRDITSSDVVTTERNLLRHANKSLRQVLSSVLRTTVAAEETIGCHVEGLLEASLTQRPPPESFRPYGREPSTESFHGSKRATDSVSVWSGETETDGGLKISQQMTDNLLLGAGLPLENEEYLMNISTRLQVAVEKLLVAITESTNQVSVCNHSIETVAWSPATLAADRFPLGLSWLLFGHPMMDSHRSYWNSTIQGNMWMEGEDQDVYEVESRVPLPRPFPLSSILSEKNSVVVQTQISHVNHRTNGHLLKVVSKISLPTPPYTLEHARVTQTELMRESFRHNQEMGELLQKQEELQERLGEEASAREQLALELHKAEGLIDGYTGERATLEEQVRQKEELLLSLEQELQVTSSRLHELEQEKLETQQERELLSRQQDAMKEHAGSRELRLVEAAVVAAPEADLLDETEKLMKEKVEVQRQAEKENLDLLKQVKLLEAELEEQVNRVIELEHAQKTECRDLIQQIQALEKQLEKNRKFLDEQAVDREHERDVFQQEILKLEDQLKNPQKQQTGSEHRSSKVEQLSGQLKEKADWCSELLLGSERLQREVEERNEEIDKLEGRIRELEQALLASTEPLEQVVEKKQHVSVSEAGESSLENQLQTERDALDRKEKEISNLEEQLEQFREELENKSEEVQQLQMQLEIQEKEMDTQHQHLATRDSMLQVMEDKDREIALLNEQMAKLHHKETSPDNKGMDEKEELIRELESQVECMRAEQELLKMKSEEEQDQLSAVIDKLQQELANIEQKRATYEEEDFKSQLGGPSKDEYDQMKQKMDFATKELDTLKAEHRRLLETYQRFKESALALAESEKLVESSGIEFEEALREKTAAFVVMQAQVRALEQNATSRIEDLSDRVNNLESLLGQRDSELTHNRLLVEQAQEEAHNLQQKLSKLEDKLRERVAATLVSQAQLSAVQEQSQQPLVSKDLGPNKADQDLREKVNSQVFNLGAFEMPQVDFSRFRQGTLGPTGKVVLLTEKLRELEVGLGYMQKDQELQKQLLSSSEEEVLEYERRLALLMDMLNHMRTNLGGHQKSALPQQVKANEAAESVLLRELQDSREEAVATKEKLNDHMKTSSRLQDELKVSSVEEGVGKSELLRELQEVRVEAASTREQLNTFRECCKKLQDKLQVRDLSITQLQEELQQLQTTLAKASVSPSLSPPPPSLSSTSQPKKKGGKQQGAKGHSTKDKPSLSRKDSGAASLSDKPPTPLLNSSSQPQAPRTDSATQTDPIQDHGQANTLSASAAVEEVMGEYQEKIAQMQELHAAEILDMEARHIAESEALRTEGQVLEGECKALKASIDALRSNQTSLRQERPAGSQFKDGYTSDSSSDYSQRTGYEPLNLQQDFRSTPEGARREIDESLPDKIKILLREVHQEGMQVLSLSELPLLEGEAEAGAPLHAQGWAQDREALLANVQALKDLLTQMQLHKETQTVCSMDWRGQLLGAVQQVFEKERSVLKTALYAQLDLLDTSDAVVHLNQLEQRLAKQDAHHREAMGALHSADRTTLISEIRQLRLQLETLHGEDLSPRSTANTGVQLGALWSGDPGVERGAPLGAAGGHGDNQQTVDQLRAELAQTQLELETTLRARHKHLIELDSLRAEVSQKAAEVDNLTDQLAGEKKRSRDLQWAAEKERCKSSRKEETEKEELEDLRLTLEEQQRSVAELTAAVALERHTSSQHSQQAEQERLDLQGRLAQLQVHVETERAKAQEMSAALDKERELRQASSKAAGPSEEEGEGDQGGHTRGPRGLQLLEGVLERLQTELDKKHTQVVSLLGELKAQKLEALRRDRELTSAGQRSGQKQEALQEAHAQLESTREQARAVQCQLEKEVQMRKNLEQDKRRLEEYVTCLEELREEERAASQNQEALRGGEPTSRTRGWLVQQKGAVSTGTPPLQEVPRTGSKALLDPRCSTDTILGKLQLIASKTRAMASTASGRLTAEVEGEGLSWLQSSIDEVITMLQHSPGFPSAPEPSGLLPSPLLPNGSGSGSSSGSSSSALAERLLRQNAELTGFVSRLTEEKNDLRNLSLLLEEELRRYRQAGLQGSGHSSGSRRGVDKVEITSALLSQERDAWSGERSRLEKALHLSQAEVARHRAESRAHVLRDMARPEADNPTLKRMYGKYLRSESFRKALVYQKKYLLLLLGGFQECEEATLALVSRMGGRPSLSSLDPLAHRRRGLSRFRSAVRVAIALSRMRFLVKRWQKATGMGSTSTISRVNRNSLGQSTGIEVRDFLQPGSVEVFVETRGGGGGSSSRGRTGRDSPRLALSSAQHRYHLAGDPGPLTCSHLQNYDPDRALTDYISRLEALQRRLGSVTSGSSSYAQLHFGMRR
ncbi:A-kinase anchor protein 9 [Aplochiton taeniatus]